MQAFSSCNIPRVPGRTSYNLRFPSSQILFFFSLWVQPIFPSVSHSLFFSHQSIMIGKKRRGREERHDSRSGRRSPFQRNRDHSLPRSPRHILIFLLFFCLIMQVALLRHGHDLAGKLPHDRRLHRRRRQTLVGRRAVLLRRS